MLTLGLDGDAVLGYDLLSLSYDELYGGEQMGKYHTVSRFLDLRKCGRILDIGCGTCLFYEYMTGHGWEGDYVGLDLSAGMLERAKMRGPQHIIQADGHRLPFRDKVFTHVFSFTVIHHCIPEIVQAEAERVSQRLVVISQHRRLGLRLYKRAAAEHGDEEFIVTEP